ncbi:MAG: hypothetical protein RIR00_865 [Pseudomonadota bacterium]|jgi:hypothetical protein
MAAELWLPGQYARLSVVVSTPGGLHADPGSLRLLVRAPDGQVDIYVYGSAAEVVREGSGLFHADILLTASGNWTWRWETTEPNVGADEGALIVAASQVLPILSGAAMAQSTATANLS